MKRVMLVAIVVALLANPVSAVVILDDSMLDQSQELFNGAARPSATRSLAQTFEAGMDGHLVGFALMLNASFDQAAPATISILAGGVDGVPTGPALWSQNYDFLAPGWFTVNISDMPVPMTIGSTYAIVLQTTDSTLGNPDIYWNRNSANDAYGKGELLENKGSGWQLLTSSGNPQPQIDAAFRTYMVIPEPGTLALLLSTCLLIACKGARQRT